MLGWNKDDVWAVYCPAVEYSLAQFFFLRAKTENHRAIDNATTIFETWIQSKYLTKLITSSSQTGQIWICPTHSKRWIRSCDIFSETFEVTPQRSRKIAQNNTCMVSVPIRIFLCNTLKPNTKYLLRTRQVHTSSQSIPQKYKWYNWGWQTLYIS